MQNEEVDTGAVFQNNTGEKPDRGFTIFGKSCFFSQALSWKDSCDPPIIESLTLEENDIKDNILEEFRKTVQIGHLTSHDQNHNWRVTDCKSTLNFDEYNQEAHRELFVDRSVEFGEAADNNEIKLLIGFEDIFGIQLSPVLPLSIEYVGYYCFFGDCLVEMKGQAMKLVRDVRVGDIVRTGDSFAAVIGTVKNQKKSNTHFDLVQVDNLIVTKGHPIKIQRDDNSDEWIKPETVGTSIFVDTDEVFNFVLERQTSIFVNDIECATLGQFCPGVDSDDTFFGSTRVLSNLRKRSDWPNVILRGFQSVFE